MSEPYPIPTVQFYGEEQWRADTDDLHCEPLITRSRAHAFKIRPHRHPGLVQLFHLQSGQGQAKIDGHIQTVHAPQLIIISPMCVHDFLWSGDVSGTVVSISIARLERTQRALNRSQPVLSQTRLVPLEKDETRLETLLEMLLEEYRNAPDSSRDRSLQALIDLLVIRCERLQQRQAGKPVMQHPRSRHLETYLERINQSYHHGMTVEQYADELGITPPYLNQLCKQLTGRTAIQLLHERRLLEAQRQLTYTATRVQDIAAELGFNDPAYFTRFFRNQTGVSPRQYRQIAGQRQGPPAPLKR